jgi:hypothetical protein
MQWSIIEPEPTRLPHKATHALRIRFEHRILFSANVDWQSRAIATETKVAVLTSRVEQEIPALQAKGAELEGDRSALKVALQKTLA